MERQLELKRDGLALGQLAELAHRYLRVDVVCVFELAPQGPVCRAMAGEGAAFDISVGRPWAPSDEHTGKLLASERANVVSDGPLGSFIGVPLRLSDGSIWGTFCCISGARQAFAERDARVVSMLGELVVNDLDQRRASRDDREAIRSVLEAESVDVAYQPIFDLRSGVCIGLEALARFPKGFPPPDRTFAIAEQVGLGLELEELVVRQAWSVLERLGPGQFLALNLTPDSLLALARRANDRPEVTLSSLVVEVTEHRAIEAYEELRDELATLRGRGLRIAVDDVGAGYASLRHVVELRPDIVKVDRWLIDGLADDCARQVAVGSFVSLANSLGSMLIAEGIERREDLEAAYRLGLQAGQGYLLGRPSCEPQVRTRWLTQTARLPRRARVNESSRRTATKPRRIATG